MCLGKNRALYILRGLATANQWPRMSSGWPEAVLGPQRQPITDRVQALANHRPCTGSGQSPTVYGLWSISVEYEKGKMNTSGNLIGLVETGFGSPPKIIKMVLNYARENWEIMREL